MKWEAAAPCKQAGKVALLSVVRAPLQPEKVEVLRIGDRDCLVKVLAAELGASIVPHLVFLQKALELALSTVLALRKVSLLTEIVIGGDAVLKDVARVFQDRRSCNTTTFILLVSKAQG